MEFERVCKRGRLEEVRDSIFSGKFDYEDGMKGALEGGHVRLVNILSLESRNSVFVMACKYGTLDTIMKVKGDLIPDPHSLRTGFIHLCKKGDLPSVKFFASLITSDVLKEGFLDACTQGHTEVVEFLIGNPARLRLEILSEGLEISHNKRHIDICILLVKKGATVLPYDAYRSNFRNMDNGHLNKYKQLATITDRLTEQITVDGLPLCDDIREEIRKFVG